jgi:hypothetical protein
LRRFTAIDQGETDDALAGRRAVGMMADIRTGDRRRGVDADQIRRQVEQIAWFHSIDLGHGIVTPGCGKSAEKLRQIRLPERLDGLSVLDVGAWDGFFSFEAERRGVARSLLSIRTAGVELVGGRKTALTWRDRS